MAAPSITARTVPSGYKLPDGFKSTIAFANNPGIQFWEQTLAPPAYDGGEPIKTTTMLNTLFHTYSPHKLIDVKALQVEAAYDPNVIPEIQGIINIPTSVTFHFPDNASLAWYGYLQAWEPKELKEGEMPMCTIKIAVTNYDYVNNIEVGPLYTPASGTA